MTVDFTSLMPTIIVAIIGWLIRNAFQDFKETLGKISAQVTKLDDRQDKHEHDLTVLKTILRQKGVLSP